MARKKKCPLCDEKPDSSAVMHTHLRNIHGVVSLAVRDRLLKGDKPEDIAAGGDGPKRQRPAASDEDAGDDAGAGDEDAGDDAGAGGRPVPDAPQA